VKRKRPLEKCNNRWEDNIELDLKKRGDLRLCTGLSWFRVGINGGLF